jgi:AcrR family transcriptional regulator
LLASAVSYAEEHGIGDLSLRELAAAIGTSHRMLIYHFGSKDGLLVEVVKAVESEQRAFLASLAAEATPAPADTIRTMWRQLSDPAMAAKERLFYDVYVNALQGRLGDVDFLDNIVDNWVDVAVENRPAGQSRDDAAADARLGVAVMRGLLLDLLATGDRTAVNAAAERYASLYDRR